jgi:glycosyltransferase involved in cell wall biosynthesis
MIHHNISRFILTLGCDYKNPRGGVSQVLSEYSKIFEEFHFIPTTKETILINKFFIAVLAYLKLFLFLLLKKYKIIHIHGASYNSFWRKSLYINLGRFMNVKIIYHIHGAEFKLFYKNNMKKIKKMFKKCDVIIALSESWKTFFEKEIGCTHIFVVNNIIPFPPKKEIDRGSEICYLLFMGKISSRKGIWDLLDVLSDHKLYFENKVILYVCGNGEINRLLSFVSDNSLEKIIQYKGWVANDEKIDMFYRSDVFILPSYNEGLPISILEAMSYGLPVITTPVGGITEIVKNNVTGILVNPGNQKQIKEAIDILITNKNLRNEMGQASYRSVVNYFPDKVEKQLQDIYKNLLF